MDLTVSHSVAGRLKFTEAETGSLSRDLFVYWWFLIISRQSGPHLGRQSYSLNSQAYFRGWFTLAVNEPLKSHALKTGFYDYVSVRCLCLGLPE